MLTSYQRLALIVFAVGEHITITEIVTGQGPTLVAAIGCALATLGAVFFVREPQQEDGR